jgi:lipoate-protein ligase B
MTFHLAQGLTTLNTRKPKPRKMTVKRLETIKKLWKEHNKYMKKIKANSCIMTFDEYVKYTQGKYKSKRKTATMHKSNMVPVWEEEDAKDIARMRR